MSAEPSASLDPPASRDASATPDPAAPPPAPAMLRRTAVYDRHVALGAKTADFGGWLMPIEYSGGGIVREHQAVRERVGLFDASHLGKVELSGLGAAALVDATLTNALGRIAPGQAQYTLCCDADGGTVDDLLVYLRADDDVLLVPNAANAAEVAALLAGAAPASVVVRDRHEDFAVFAVQGPLSDEVLDALGLPSGHDYLHFVEAEWRSGGGRVPVTVCRTGYTGERGYELLPPSEVAGELWDAVLAEVRRLGGLPVGLGARDTLRTEMGYALHGHELSRTISPVQARLTWAVGWDKPTFWGREALLAQREAKQGPIARGLLALERGVPRADMRVVSSQKARIDSGQDREGKDGEGEDGEREVGRTTSGTFSPTLGQGIALALLDRSVEVGSEVALDVRGRRLPARVVNPPFVEARVRAD